MRDPISSRQVAEDCRRAGRLWVAVVVATTLVAAGCGDEGLVDPMMPGGIRPELDSIQNEVFTPRCALPGCHDSASAGAQFGLDLTDGRSFGSLVGVPSGEDSTFLRVEPGNPADSWLMMKLTGDPRIIGDPMPRKRAPLSPVELAAIAQWIEDGAAP